MAKNYKMIPHNDEEIAKLIARLEVMYEGRNFEEIQSIAFNLSSFANATMLRVGFLNISERLSDFRNLLLLSVRCFANNQGFVSPLRYLESPDSSEYHEHVALFIRAMKNLFEALENNEPTHELEDCWLWLLAHYVELRSFLNPGGLVKSGSQNIVQFSDVIEGFESFFKRPYSIARGEA